MTISRICILGGTGFVGGHLVKQLAADNNLELRLLTRKPQQHRDLLIRAGIELISVNPFDSCQLQQAFNGCQAVINLVGILNEAGSKQTFKRLHVDLVRAIVEAAESTGIKRYLHMSSLHANADTGPSRYQFTKGEGEKLAHERGGAFMNVTSLRASVIFGPNDSFFNRFAGLLRFAPGFFPLACANSRFQPVFVGDVAQAFIKCLSDPNTFGKVYNLCGPEIFTLGELVAYTAQTMGRKIKVIALNDTMARLQGHVMGMLPNAPFSYDNYLSLQVDSVCGANVATTASVSKNGSGAQQDNGLAALGITPTAINAIVPTYLGHKPNK